MASSPLTHNQIWTALDRLAKRADLSPSGLAKRSGLDPTTFNKSKRITPDGRARWPSTESVAKALAATQSSVESFVSLISDSGGAAQAVPLIAFAEAGSSGLFQRRRFSGRQRLGRNRVSRHDRRACLCAGNFRRFDAAGLPRRRRHHRVARGPVRRGDRVVVKVRAGEVMIKELKRQTAKQVELKSLNADHPERTLSLETWCGSPASSGQVSDAHFERHSRGQAAAEPPIRDLDHNPTNPLPATSSSPPRISKPPRW
jgi:phage repressor protein C with HTH and peptisase S24 domain